MRPSSGSEQHSERADRAEGYQRLLSWCEIVSLCRAFSISQVCCLLTQARLGQQRAPIWNCQRQVVKLPRHSVRAQDGPITQSCCSLRRQEPMLASTALLCKEWGMHSASSTGAKGLHPTKNVVLWSLLSCCQCRCQLL